MKLSAYEDTLQQNFEYQQALEKRKLHFDIANAILRARIRKGWSQEELANLSGLRQSRIANIEAGMANPTVSELQKVFKVLEITTTFLS
jgi:ribosome-binding protein aMBF1 (putative translation factor)